jgi:hypothetical protein
MSLNVNLAIRGMKMNMLKQFNEKRRIGITASALLAGGGLILVLISLMLLYLWYPAILQDNFADANSLGASFPAVYFGIPLIISANVLGHIRLAVAISRRTGITFSLLLAQGSLLLMLLGLLILWHPVITASSGGAILIAGILLLISGSVSLLIAGSAALAHRGLRRVA